MQLRKKRARQEATTGGSILPTAVESAAKANEVWTKTLDEELARLEAAQDTMLLVLKTALKLASEAGSRSVGIRSVPSIGEHLTIENVSLFHLIEPKAPHHQNEAWRKLQPEAEVSDSKDCRNLDRIC